jgi:glycosyltransferase involved in cell wall biosynthesis
MPKVSVILPVYNGESTIQRTLLSLLEQTYKDFEIILCIDGSNDQSEQIINETFLKTAIPYKLIKNDFNLGLALTMNRLTDTATGEYIAVAEQDDVYPPQRLSLQVDILDLHQNIGLVSGIAEHFDYDKNKATTKTPGLLVHGHQYPENPKENFLLNYIDQIKVVNSCMMIRKSMHVRSGLYFDNTYGNVSVDWSYILRAALFTQFYGIHETLVKLDRTPGRKNITQNKQQQYKAARALLADFRSKYPELITDTNYQKAYHNQVERELASLAIDKLLLKIFHHPLKLMVNELKKRMKRKMNPE